jgi:hypothetical protein
VEPKNCIKDWRLCPRCDHSSEDTVTRSSPLVKFRELNAPELTQGADSGMAFNTVTIDTPVYLPYLLSTFLGKGGGVVRAKVMHVSQVAQGAFTSAKPGISLYFLAVTSLILLHRCNCRLCWNWGTIPGRHRG